MMDPEICNTAMMLAVVLSGSAIVSYISCRVVNIETIYTRR